MIPFKCATCGNEFTTSKNLMAHIPVCPYRKRK